MAKGTVTGIVKVEVRRVKASLVDLSAKGLSMFARCPKANFEEGLGFRLEADEHLLIISKTSFGPPGERDSYWLIDGDIQEVPTSMQRAEVLAQANEIGRVSLDTLCRIARGDKLLEFASYVKAKAWLALNMN